MSEEIKKTPSPEGLLTWIEVHKVKGIICALGLVVAGVAVYVAQWYEDWKEREAGTELYRMLTRDDTGEGPGAKDLMDFARTHVATSAGERAHLLSARTLFENGRYDEAGERFASFRSRYADSPFLSTAIHGEAASRDAAGDLEQAARIYRTVLETYPNSPVAAMARLHLAGILEEQDKPGPALETYTELDRPGVHATWSSLARERRDAILLRHPELVPEPEDETAEGSPDIVKPGNGSVESATESEEMTEDIGSDGAPGEEAATPSEADGVMEPTEDVGSGDDPEGVEASPPTDPGTPSEAGTQAAPDASVENGEKAD